MPRRIRPGGPFLQGSQVDSPSVVDDDTSDSSWSTIQSGALLSAKLALAGVALASSLAHGIQQQDDDLPHAPLLSGHESVEVVAVGQAPLPTVFSELDGYFSPSIREESESQELFIFVAKAVKPLPPWATDDELPSAALIHGHDSVEVTAVGKHISPTAFESDDDFASPAPVVLEEGEPQEFRVLRAQVTSPFLADDEIVPQRLDEDYDWQPFNTKAIKSTAIFSADDEIVPVVVDEEYDWQPAITKAARPAPIPASDDDLPAIFTPVEDYWLILEARSAQPVVRALDVQEELPQSGLFDEEYWQKQQFVQKSVVAFWTLGDGFSPQPVTDEDYDWQPFSAKAVRSLVVWATEDDLPAPTALEDGEQQELRALRARAPKQVLWADEEIVPQPAFTPDEDYYWQPPISIPAKPAPASAIDDDIPRAPLAHGHDSIEVAAIGGDALPGAFAADDEIIPQSVAAPDDSYWLVPDSLSTKVEIVDWPVTGGFSQTVAQPALDDAVWQIWCPEPRRPFIPLWSVEDEFPSAAADLVPVGSSAQRALYKPAVLRLAGGNEDFPTAAFTEETAWQVDTPAYTKPVVALWAEDDFPQQVAQTAIDEAVWVVDTPAYTRPTVKLWTVEDDEIVQQPDDDAYWQPCLPAVSKPFVMLWTLDDDFATLRTTMPGATGVYVLTGNGATLTSSGQQAVRRLRTLIGVGQ